MINGLRRDSLNELIAAEEGQPGLGPFTQEAGHFLSLVSRTGVASWQIGLAWSSPSGESLGFEGKGGLSKSEHFSGRALP
jgi:hypothetical protein